MRQGGIGWFLVGLFAVLPIALWAIAGPISGRYLADGAFSAALVSRSLGQIMGIIGLSLFAFVLVLGTRARWLEDLFGGMNRVYIAHHVLGGLAFVLLLMHPVLLGLRFVFLPQDDRTPLFLFTSDPAVAYGTVALALMIVFLVLTFYVKLPYQIWRFTHKFMGLAFVFAVAHVLLIPSDVTAYAPLKYFTWLVALGGLSAVLYRTILGTYIGPKHRCIVERVRRESSEVVEVTFRPIDGKPFDYEPGQFAFVRFPGSKDLDESHPFSLASDPAGQTFAIGVKALGDFTHALVHGLRQGELAIVEGPFGRNSHRRFRSKDQIWIAAGIGITPFLGMARSLRPGDGYRVDLHYSYHETDEVPFLRDLEAIAKGNPSFRFFPWSSRAFGRLSIDGIMEKSRDFNGKEIVICGPPPMMQALEGQLKKHGVPGERIHTEAFSLES
jgi:predicted ferric reductase